MPRRQSRLQGRPSHIRGECAAFTQTRSTASFLPFKLFKADVFLTMVTVFVAVSPWRLLLILSLLQDATADLEKKVKRICDILKEKQELAERERALTQRMSS